MKHKKLKIALPIHKGDEEVEDWLNASAQQFSKELLGLIKVPLKKGSNKISNKIPQVDRQEAEVRPKVIEPDSQLAVKDSSKMLKQLALAAAAREAAHVEPKVEPIREVKQKSVPSQQKAETKLQVQPEPKEDFKASNSSSSSSGPMRKVVWRAVDEANTSSPWVAEIKRTRAVPSSAKEVQSEQKAEAKVSSWRTAPSAEVDAKKRVVPMPSKKDVKGEQETTQEVKVWKPVETPKEEVKAKTAEPKQEAKAKSLPDAFGLGRHGLKLPRKKSRQKRPNQNKRPRGRGPNKLETP
eukprot:s232_g21.t1